MRKFGLIGKTLKHSFSGRYFAEKFEREQLNDCRYELYELPTIEALSELLISHRETLKGLNVTTPYKREVVPFLDELDAAAERIGAVNVIKVTKGRLKGYNSDYYGFRSSLEGWLGSKTLQALILGTGGASDAVRTTLEDINIPFQYVSRHEGENALTYDDVLTNEGILSDYRLIINCTPLGTYPNVEEKPALPYHQLTSEHLLYDLVYNPEVTAFLREGVRAGAKTKNGADMLALQAEKSWEIWNGRI